MAFSLWGMLRGNKSDQPPVADPTPVVAIAPLNSNGPAERPSRPKRTHDIEARYDAAQTTPSLENHWAMADGLSADESHSPVVRKTLRERSRHECGNNATACGIIRTLGNDVVGNGPRVQCLLSNAEHNRLIQADWIDWCKKTRFAKRLRMMRQTKSKDGEVFALLTYNPKLKCLVKLDFKPIECDQITNPYWTGYETDEVDGIKFDEYGNPTEYCMLRYHPGSNIPGAQYDLDWIPAHSMIHLFLLERPGQHRGVPEMTSSLSLFAMVRNFSVATLDAARFAATPVGVVYSENPVDEDDDESFTPMSSFAIPQGALTAIGNNNKLAQLKPEHPTTTHNEYTSNLITTAARPISMSRNIATGDSSGYNFSSARLDRSLYYKAVGIDQADLEVECVDVVFDAWWEEYRHLDETQDKLPREVLELESVPHESHWDQPVDTDPQGTAAARKINLETGMTSFQTEYAAIGLDAETELRKQAQILNLPYEVYISRVTDQLFASSAGSVSTHNSTSGAPVDTPAGTPAPSAGAFAGVRKRDFSNNMKQTLEVLDAFVNGASEVLTRASLVRLGWSADDAQAFINDARDGQIDDPQLQPGGSSNAS